LNFRIRILQIIFILIFALYAYRLFGMQIVRGSIYQARAENITRRTNAIAAQRGEIFDRTFSEPIVQNSDSYAVSITPGEIPSEEIDEILERLSTLLSIPREQIDRTVPASAYSLYQNLEVASGLSFDTVATVAENADALPGVTWQLKPTRNYIATGSLSHITGYVGNITRDELTVLYNEGYKTGDTVGKAGIERQYDQILRGTEGWETRTVDARGRRINIIEGVATRKPAESGKNLVLTIDQKIQTLAEKALGTRIGAVVVMRPNGEILAMVSYPWYDPNLFNRPGSGTEYAALLNDENKPLLNRAIQSNYPPASTFKIVMSTGIYNEKIIPPLQAIECKGYIEYGNRTLQTTPWRCWQRIGHGRLNLHQSMAQSCDVYYWVVGRDYLGVDRIVEYARDYGFGSLTDIDLPGEVAGFVPSPQWKQRRFHENWLGGDTMNMSIGQGFTLVTPIQMADMVAMVVNSGTVYKPHLLKEVRDPITGEVISENTPQILHKSTVDPSVFAEVREDMRGVISYGTAVYPLNIKSVQIAGKTGTGEVAGLTNQWHSWLASYAPFQTDKPEERVIVSVIVEAVNHWDWWAPYCSAIIYQGIFANQTYEESIRSLGFQNLQPIEGRRE
jgi:penicillin-binding protein 2